MEKSIYGMLELVSEKQDKLKAQHENETVNSKEWFETEVKLAALQTLRRELNRTLNSVGNF